MSQVQQQIYTPPVPYLQGPQVQVNYLTNILVLLSVSLDCTFMLDWNYLGFNTTEYVNVCCRKYWNEIQFQQRYFVSNVTSKLYGNSSLNFAANFYFYGHVDKNHCFLFSVQDDYLKTYNEFDSLIGPYTPSPDCPTELC